MVLTGLPHEPSSLSFFPVVRREVTIAGSMIYQDEFPEAVRLLASGEVRPERLLTHRFPLAEIGRPSPPTARQTPSSSPCFPTARARPAPDAGTPAAAPG